MCLAIMVWAVCWKKVLKRNFLNVLIENLGDFWGYKGSLPMISLALFLVI